MAKHQQQGEPQQNYRPGPLPRQDSQTVRLATLGGVVALLMISFSNWREIDQIQTSLDGKLVQLQTQLAQVSTKVDNVSTRAAAPPRPSSAGPRSQPCLPDQDRGGAIQGTGQCPDHLGRVLGLPMTVLFQGRSGPEEDPGSLPG